MSNDYSLENMVDRSATTDQASTVAGQGATMVGQVYIPTSLITPVSHSMSNITLTRAYGKPY